MRELGKDFGLVVVATRGFFRGKFFIPSSFFLHFFQLSCKGNRLSEGCISSLPQEKVPKQPHHFKKNQGSFLIPLRLAMFLLLSIQVHEYSKKKLTLPQKRTLDTPSVYMKEK